jgi:hypothetical protein
MATPEQLTELLDAVNTLLNLPSAQQLLVLNSNTCERAYEAYVLSLCVEAVRRAGGTARMKGILSGLDPSPVVFRGAPGSMASRNQDFAYASCALKGKRFELHVDVEYQGTSGAPHEIDVSMCDEDHAQAVRNTYGMPKTEGNKLLMAFECKFYDKTPGVTLGRTFVGLLSDCGALRLRGFVSNLPSDNLSLYFSMNRRPQPFLGLIPTDGESEDRFIRNVEQELRRWAS